MLALSSPLTNPGWGLKGTQRRQQQIPLVLVWVFLKHLTDHGVFGESPIQ